MMVDKKYYIDGYSALAYAILNSARKDYGMKDPQNAEKHSEASEFFNSEYAKALANLYLYGANPDDFGAAA